jgi:putative FmdB family regulatory protein
MPVYEFYCAECHTIFNFLSRRIRIDKRPDCPKCGRPDLDRRVSLFACSLGRQEENDTEAGSGLGEEQMERAMAAMASMAGEMDGSNEEDPRQMARVMRTLKEAIGMPLGDGMEEAIRRLEGGEDPEEIEQELGDLLANDQPFPPRKSGSLKRRAAPPAQDDTLYLL